MCDDQNNNNRMAEHGKMATQAVVVDKLGLCLYGKKSLNGQLNSFILR